MKAVIFDSGTIITFAMNGLIDLLKELKKNFDGKFFITEEVKHEIIDRPLRIKRFELEALTIQNLLEEGVIEFPYEFVSKKNIENSTSRIFDFLNHMFYARNEMVHIVEKGEVTCLALSLLLTEKGIDNVVAIDERTARMICEKPENLRQLLERKLHAKVNMKETPDFLNGIKVIRSSELMYVAYKKGLIKIKSNATLDALLYASKFKGNSISFDEIEQIKRL
jgi:hypothetical protein